MNEHIRSLGARHPDSATDSTGHGAVSGGEGGGLAGSLIWLCLLLLGLVVFFAIARCVSVGFLSPDSLRDLSRAWLPMALMAPTMVLLLRRGGLDWSVATVMALTGAVAAWALKERMDWPVAFLLGMGSALTVGLIHFLFVGLAGLHAVLVTLATAVAVRALSSLITKDAVLFVSGPLSDILPALILIGWLAVVVVAVTVEVLAQFTRFGGRRCRTNHSSAGSFFGRLFFTGLPYIAMSCLAGLAGLIQTTRFQSASSMQGVGAEFDVLLAAALGGAVMSKPVGSAIGALAGGLLVVGFRKLLVDIGVNEAVIRLTLGCLFLLVMVAGAGFHTLAGFVFKSCRSRP